MAEPTSSMTHKDLFTEVARISGDPVEDAKLDLRFGYGSFLRSWPWSFTCPVLTLSVTATSATTTMPENFAELIEWPSYAASSGKGPIIEMVTTKEILDLFAGGATTGDPYKFALEASTFVAATGQRWAVRWYPTPSADLTLTYTYRVIQPKMSGDTDYPVGGPMHNDAILWAGLKHWEIRNGHTTGVYHDFCREELAKSIRFDQSLTAGRNLGSISTPRYRVVRTQIGTTTEV